VSAKEKERWGGVVVPFHGTDGGFVVLVLGMRAELLQSCIHSFSLHPLPFPPPSLHSFRYLQMKMKMKMKTVDKRHLQVALPYLLNQRASPVEGKDGGATWGGCCGCCGGWW